MKKPIILIADDEIDIICKLEIAFGLNGFETVSALNGQEAIAKARAYNPNLAIIDIQLPVFSGLQACRELKSNPETRHIPVVLLSVGGLPEQKAACDLGADDYITKPFVAHEVVERINWYFQIASIC